MTEYLLVDGYNILHAWPGLKKALERDFEDARVKLVNIMANYQALKGIKVIVVFDAHLVKGGSGSRETVAGVEVIYTVEGETADMLIEKFVGQLGEGVRVTVATSDWTQQRLVFGKGAVRMSARELEQEVNEVLAEVRGYNGSLHSHDRKLRGYLDDKVRETLEKMRRQK